MVRLTSAVKETLSNTVRVVSSKEGMKKLLGISLYRNAFYLMLNEIQGNCPVYEVDDIMRLIKTE